ncbi:MAG: hypothetical protein HOG49_19105 [Candidatus Scalindua sp.]|nr:hypothetical protein [Candidatus Scalindua sp.]
MGSGVREMDEQEKGKRDAIRRSAYTIEDVKKGTLLSKVKVEFRRPGFHIQPDEYEKLLINKSIVKNNINKDQPIKYGDIL